MPQACVKHSALALRSLAGESANECEETLRRKPGEGSTCVACECAAIIKPSCNAFCVLNFVVRYIGVRAADGSVEHQADAMARSMLVFRWSVRRGDSESFHESEVMCDNALERGVPHPETSYCTKAELEHIAKNAALSHETTLRQTVGQDNVAVMCRRAPTKIERARF